MSARAYDKANAEWILSKFKEWGLDAKIETYDVLFPTPKERVLELIEPRRFTAKLQEPTVGGDPTSSQHDEQLPSYNAYSIDGEVTAPLVYVNYGAPDDYDAVRAPGSIGQRSHCHRPIRSHLAGHQAESGRRTRGRWVASSIPTRATTVITKATRIRWVRFVRPTACSVEA